MKENGQDKTNTTYGLPVKPTLALLFKPSSRDAQWEASSLENFATLAMAFGGVESKMAYWGARGSAPTLMTTDTVEALHKESLPRLNTNYAVKGGPVRDPAEILGKLVSEWIYGLSESRNIHDKNRKGVRLVIDYAPEDFYPVVHGLQGFDEIWTVSEHSTEAQRMAEQFSVDIGPRIIPSTFKELAAMSVALKEAREIETFVLDNKKTSKGAELNEPRRLFRP